ncbi:aldehyde dehydrogenase 4A1-like protein, partial [Lentinula raphanica]
GDDSKGYFIQPTVILTKDPHMATIIEEIFDPVLIVYLFKDANYKKTLELINTLTENRLTGSIFASKCKALITATNILQNAAGNMYYNKKCIGAIIGQQPFGGVRLGGTNDRAGSISICYRFVNTRSIKENFVGLKEFHYPLNLV